MLRLCLFTACIVCSLNLYAQEFFTWIDAQGQIHNSPVNKKESSNVPKPKQTQNRPLDSKPYLSEEEFKQQQRQDKLESPAFFTWIDENGYVHNEFVESESDPVIPPKSTDEHYFDDTYVKTLRLETDVNIGCCHQYQGMFSKILLAKTPYRFMHIDANTPFSFAGESAAAFYVHLDVQQAHAARVLEVIQTKFVGKPSVIALDKNFTPLYQSHALKGVFKEQSWNQLAQTYYALEFVDPDIEFLIWYYPDAQSKKDTEKMELLISWHKQSLTK